MNTATAWRIVVGFGLVSLTTDMVSDGSRSIVGPILAALGASAFVVGLVSGISEAAGYLLRLATGPMVDRSRKYWGYTFAGYALTAACVPLLAATPLLGAAGLVVGSVLVIIERIGKAVRSPAKTVLLAGAARVVGRGKGFGVHKVMDQIGAFSGPLIVAGIIAVTGNLWSALLALVIPAIVALVVLFGVKWYTRNHPLLEVDDHAPTETQPTTKLPRQFTLFAASTAFTTLGLVGFGMMSFHLTAANIVPLASVPLVFAWGMFMGAVGAMVSGRYYDRIGGGVFLAVPLAALAVPVLSFAGNLWAVLAGVTLWGFAVGVQDSTVKAFIADLVVPSRRGAAYGIFAAYQGIGTFFGSVLAGALYTNVTLLMAITVPAQVVAFALMRRATRHES
jgi:MFS family permease